MSSFRSLGGLLIGLLGLLAVAYGMDQTVTYSIQAFVVGVAGVATGGIIVLSGRQPKKTILTQQYETKSSTNDSIKDLLKYKVLYEGSPIMQRTVNTDGIIIECNQAYVKNFGNSRNEIIGKSLFDHTADKSREVMQRTYESWKKSGKIDNVEIWFKRKDGSTFPGLISANNVYDDKGKLLGSNTQIRDISEIYEAHQVLEESEKQRIQLGELKRLNDAKEDFYLTVAREFQVPIEPIKRFSDILKDSIGGKLNDKEKDAINEIHDNAVRLEQLIQDIIDVQKLNNNKMEFKKEPFQVDEFMKSIDDTCSPMMDDKKIDLVTKASTKYKLSSDKARLRQVFYNLVQNAIDFVPQKGGKIEIEAKEDKDSILFCVKDNGIGIPEKRKDSIFKKYYQVDLSFKRKYGGSGFGLVICKGIVENLGGKIWFESKEGEGTAFYFSIPK